MHIILEINGNVIKSLPVMKLVLQVFCCIIFMNCSDIYIGETRGQLKSRFGPHILFSFLYITFTGCYYMKILSEYHCLRKETTGRL